MVSKFERRITTQLKSWLSAVGIGYEHSSSGLVVTKKDGAKVPVQVAMKGVAANGSITVHARDLSNRNIDKSLEAFRGLQLALGYDPPKQPVDRGPLPSRKCHFSDDFDLVVLRHKDFRRSPNPTNEQLKSFSVVVDKAVWRSIRKNHQVYADHGLEIEDLRQYGLAWTVNYLGLYRDDSADRSENEKNLFNYLCQRFMDFREMLDKKGRNILPMLDDAYIAMHGRPYDYTNKAGWFAADAEVDNDWEIPDMNATDEDETVAQRDRTKKDAIALLNAKLAAMPHDQMVAVLTAAVENDRIHLDARRAASRKLQMHARKCSPCSGAELPRAPGDGSVPNNLPIEDENGIVYQSAKEAASAHGVYPSNVRAVLSGKYRHTGGHVFKYVAPESAPTP
jgi:hypothetical protein